MNTSETITNLTAAMVKFHGEVKHPAKQSANPLHGSKYVNLSDILNTVRPILAKNGLFVMQTVTAEDMENQGRITVTTRLFHESGEWLESEPLALPAFQVIKGGGKVWTAQAGGSATTYAKRYSLVAFLALEGDDEDDDGNKAMGGLEVETGRRDRPRAEAPRQTPVPKPTSETNGPSNGPSISPAEMKLLGALARSAHIIKSDKLQAYAQGVINRELPSNPEQWGASLSKQEYQDITQALQFAASQAEDVSKTAASQAEDVSKTAGL